MKKNPHSPLRSFVIYSPYLFDGKSFLHDSSEIPQAFDFIPPYIFSARINTTNILQYNENSYKLKNSLKIQKFKVHNFKEALP